MNVGDKVLIETGDKGYEGVLMPSSDNDTIVLKLNSGYNIGLPKKIIKKTAVIEKHKSKEEKAGKVEHSSKKKTITILHTGGTIASKVDYETGAVVAKYTPEELIKMVPELHELANIKSKLISAISSEDMRFTNYNTIAKEIEKEIKTGVDGIIVTHGTDTLHYTSAALSFILDGLSIPVILVGAQRSSDRASSDATMNLVCAVEFILNSEFAEVGVCMHKSSNDDICWILPGLKCRKMHSSRRDAFKAINAKPYAEVDFKTRKIHLVNPNFKQKEKKSLKLHLFKDVKIGLLKARPNMFADEIKVFLKYDGLVLEGTGLGHMPIGSSEENKRIFEELKKLGKKIPIVMSTQTLFGRVNMNVYSPGRMLQEIGVIGNYSDMTPETAYIKLAWLLSNHPKEVKKMFGENLRGELGNRTSDEFLE